MNDNAPEPQEEKPGLISRTLNIIAYPASAVVGGLYVHNHIRDASYDGLKKVGKEEGGVFHEEYKIRAEKVEDLFKQVNEKAITPKAFAKARHAADVAYSKAADTTMERLGYGSMAKRFAHLERNQKFQTTMTFATAAGVTLGVLLTIANSKSLLERLGHRKDDEQTPAR